MYHKIIKVVFIASLFIFANYAVAGSYPIEKITHIYTDMNGKISIKWPGSPNPGECGSSYGWVTIESTADKALKTFVYSLHVSGSPALIVTSGCVGTAERVTAIYSPGG